MTGTSSATKPANTSVPTPIYRKQIPVVYGGAGVAVPVKLFKTLLYRDIQLELTGQPTLTAANNTQANTAMGDEWGCVTQIQWTVNGSDQLLTLSGDDLFWMNYFWYGQAPHTTSTLGDAATANPAFDSILTIPAWMPRAFHPFDTCVDGGRYNDVQMSITFGSFTAVNSAATAWTANPQIAIVSNEQVLPSDPSDQPKLNRVVKKLTNTVAGANSSYVIPLDAGVSYARFIINQKTSAGTADTTGQILNVQVVGAGGRIYADLPWQNLVQGARNRSRLPQTVARRSTSSNDQSWGFLNLVQDGRLGESLPNPADARLVFNVAGACQINVIMEQIFPL